jgi:hypothetical protein
MKTVTDNYNKKDLSLLIKQSILRLDKYQQIKLFEFINSLNVNNTQKSNILLKYEGCIEKGELDLMRTAIKDCEKIDKDEW